MYSKLCTTILFFHFSMVLCKKSFTVILDSTESMREEILIIKRNMASSVKEIGKSNQIENYILLTFSDPGKNNLKFLIRPEQICTVTKVDMNLCVNFGALNGRRTVLTTFNINYIVLLTFELVLCHKNVHLNFPLPPNKINCSI